MSAERRVLKWVCVQNMFFAFDGVVYFSRSPKKGLLIEPTTLSTPLSSVTPMTLSRTIAPSRISTYSVITIRQAVRTR